MARTIYFGENTLPAGTTAGDPVTARADFLARLTGVGSQDFESFTDLESGPFVVSFPGSVGNIQATITGINGGGTDVVIYGAPGAGRFNTTPGGANYLEATDNYSITFDQPISAFGFYGTDIGDFDAGIQIVLYDETMATETISLPTTIDGPSGALMFWGFVDDAVRYARIDIIMLQSGGEPDIFGFDDFVIGDIDQVDVPDEPEPAARLRVTRGWGSNRHILTVRIE